MFTIRVFPFDANGQTASALVDGGYNWPVVYLINNDTDIYVGETTDFEQQFLKHLKNAERNNTGYSQIRFAYDGTENQSAVKEYKSDLIRLFMVDGRFPHVISSIPRLSQSYEYHQRFLYNTKIQTLWDQLYDLNLTKKNYQEVRNNPLYKFSPFTSLTSEQLKVMKDLLADFVDSLSSQKKGAAIISGGAGTGKTLMAVKIIDILLNSKQYITDRKQLQVLLGEDWDYIINKIDKYIVTNGPLKIAYIAPQQSFNVDMKKVFGKMPWHKGQQIVHNTSSIVTRYESLDPFDIVLVDETHRLKHRSGMGNDIGLFDENRRRLKLSTEATQMDIILARSKYSCFFYDSSQSIKNSDITKTEIERSLSSVDSSPLRRSINIQKRCLGGGNYEKFINDVLSGNPSPHPFKNYDFRVYEDVSTMINDIRKLDKSFGLCRNLAGFSWPWKTKKFIKENSKILYAMGGLNKGKNACNLLKLNQYDISIDQNQYVWNIQSKGWITSPGARDEIGCIHTSQGYDLNYCGVILGSDIRYNPISKNIEIDPTKFCDPFLRHNKKSISDEDIVKYIINAYRTLLLRGIYGCYVYAVDCNLRKFLMQCWTSINCTIKEQRDDSIQQSNCIPSKQQTLSFSSEKIAISNNRSNRNPAEWFGQLVVSLRKKQGISQEELAFRAGINRSYMGVIERGEKSPSVDTISKVAKGLGLSVQDLFKLDD